MPEAERWSRQQDWDRNPWQARVLFRLMRLELVALSRIWGAVIGVDMGTKVPENLIFPHPMGIVIHRSAVIGKNCVIYQGVTIGTRGRDSRPPTLGDDVIVWPSATIAGPVVVGDGAVIGPNTLVIDDVPPGAVVVSTRAQSLRRGVVETSLSNPPTSDEVG